MTNLKSINILTMGKIACKQKLKYGEKEKKSKLLFLFNLSLRIDVWKISDFLSFLSLNKIFHLSYKNFKNFP